MWCPPPRGIIKINVDASFSSTARISTLGAVASNSEAEVGFWAITRIEEVESPIQAELYAILLGLQVARERNFENIQPESDCLKAVKEILKKD